MGRAGGRAAFPSGCSERRSSFATAVANPGQPSARRGATRGQPNRAASSGRWDSEAPKWGGGGLGKGKPCGWGRSGDPESGDPKSGAGDPRDWTELRIGGTSGLEGAEEEDPGRREPVSRGSQRQRSRELGGGGDPRNRGDPRDPRSKDPGSGGTSGSETPQSGGTSGAAGGGEEEENSRHLGIGNREGSVGPHKAEDRRNGDCGDRGGWGGGRSRRSSESTPTSERTSRPAAPHRRGRAYLCISASAAARRGESGGADGNGG